MITIDYIEDLLRMARAARADPADRQICAVLGLVGLRPAQVRATARRMLEDLTATESLAPALRIAAEAAVAQVAAMV